MEGKRDREGKWKEGRRNRDRERRRTEGERGKENEGGGREREGRRGWEGGRREGREGWREEGVRLVYKHRRVCHLSKLSYLLGSSRSIEYRKVTNQRKGPFFDAKFT